jgi:hypothetical protein
MRRRLFNIATAASLLLCVAVGVLWVRGRSGADQAEWKYNRSLSDRSAASTEIDLSFGHRLGAIIRWAHAPPRDPNDHTYAYYYASADRSGGHPRLRLRHRRYVPGPDNDAFSPEDYSSTVYSGWGPVRWYSEDRSRPGDGYSSRSVHIGVSHWLVALPLLAGPMLWLKRFRTMRRARRIGACPDCGYDLRATPDRCPECGAAPDVRRRTAAIPAAGADRAGG